MNKTPPPILDHARRRHGFTLTELMVAVVVLIGVLLAVGKIFSTTSKVTDVGQATADIMQEAAAIEQQIRADFEKLSRGGLLLIRNVSVPNDISGAALLNPNRPPTARIRSDQILFFTNGLASAQAFSVGALSNHKGQGVHSRIYYGHAFQLGEAGTPFENPNAKDPYPPTNNPIFPWTIGTINMANTEFVTFAQMYQSGSQFTGTIPYTEARQWVLARQPVMLVDDDLYAPDHYEKTAYLFPPVPSAKSIFPWNTEAGAETPQIMHGRVDAAATDLGDIRRILVNGFATWQDQRDYIMDPGVGLLYYPRAERYAPSMHRVDQALTNHVLGAACSSIRIEWTYSDRTGEIRDDIGNVLWTGMRVDPSAPLGSRRSEQPWFGLVDAETGVLPYNTFDRWSAAQTIYPDNIERFITWGTGGLIEVYEASFGWNQNTPLDPDTTSPTYNQPVENLGYTPWPSAIRFTLTLHDPGNTLDGGRDFQFVIDLPKRAQNDVY